MQTVAVGVLVTTRTAEPGWTGLVAAAAFLPIGLLSPIGGVLADRLDRRRYLLLTTTGEAAFALCLTVLAATGHARPAAVTLLVFGGGAMAAVGFPAYQAILPDLVPPEELGAAVSLSSAQFNLGRVLGPALAGLAIVAGGYAWAFAANAASFLAVLGALAVVRLPSPRALAGRASLRARLIEGKRAILANPATRLTVILIALVALFASPFIALIPAVALKAFGSQAAGTSVLVSAQGVGAVAGALCLSPLTRRYGRRRVLLGDLAGVCAFLIAYGLAPDLWLGAAALVLVGAAYIGVLAGCNTTIQLHAPASLRGRMLGIYMMVLGVLYPIGSMAQGVIANAVGIRAVTVAGATVLASVLIAAVGRKLSALEGHGRAQLQGPAGLAAESPAS
jgi:MFS family permease